VRIALASDHAGLALKQALADHLRGRGHAVDDLGPIDTASVDYPAFARRVTDRLADGSADRGLLVCGTGMGMSIAANKVRGVRAALCTNELLARMARAHNDANVLCLGERVVGTGLALAIADAFFETPFEGGRHQRRVDLITALETA
jgi:ribose 5-phosphate isomerase B